MTLGFNQKIGNLVFSPTLSSNLDWADWKKEFNIGDHLYIEYRDYHLMPTIYFFSGVKEIVC